MVNRAHHPSSANRPVRLSYLERLHAARYTVVATALLWVAASAFWDVPAAVSAGATLLVALISTFLPGPRAPVDGSLSEASRSSSRSQGAAAAMLEAFPQAGFLLDGSGAVRCANRRAADLFPATRPGDPFTLTFRWPEISDALSEAQAGRARSLEFHEPGDATSIYSVNLNPLRPREFSEPFILVTFEDISDRMAVVRMRTDFVANASHELRTPLASLTGFIETLLGPARTDPQASEKFLRIMLDQARRMRRLIDDLLSLSRAEMLVHRRPTGRTDLVEVLRHVSDALGPLAGEHGVALTLNAPQSPVVLTGERDDLIQVFGNLVENGIRYGASGGRVEVSLDLRPDNRPEVAVLIQDYGPGIPPEHLPRLTERFYRVDVGASREMKGTGLGLAIVKHILTRHGGTLDVWSRPGEGARFTVRLPLPPHAPDNVGDAMT